jgi:hypothetical protein
MDWKRFGRKQSLHTRDTIPHFAQNDEVKLPKSSLRTAAVQTEMRVHSGTVAPTCKAGDDDEGKRDV